MEGAFLLPGPVAMHARVREALASPAVAHRTAYFGAVNAELMDGLRRLLDCPNVALMAGSGTLGMEAAISNLTGKKDHVVAIQNGKFGERMVDLSRRYADRVTVVEAPWGAQPNLDDVAAALEGGARALAFTLNETSTGVMNQGADLAALCRKHDALCIADTITATGSVPTPMREWGIDVAIVGSQKCIGGPAGLAFVGVSDRARERLASPSLYMDLRRYLDRADKDNQTPFTPATGLHLACVEALRILFEEGMNERFARTRRLANACRAAAESANVLLAAEPNARSDTVTAMRFPAGSDDSMRARLKQRHNVQVAGAQGAWKGHVFRIGHMAGVQMSDLATGWRAIAAELEAAGCAVDTTALEAAIN